MSNVSDIPKSRFGREYSIKVTKDTAPMLLELVSKSAVSGVQAHLLAELYTQASAAVRTLENERDDAP